MSYWRNLCALGGLMLFVGCASTKPPVSDSAWEEVNQNYYNQLFDQLVVAFPTSFGLTNPDHPIDDRFHYQFPDPAAVQRANFVDQVEDVNSKIEQFQLGDRAPVLKRGRYTAGAESPSVYYYYGLWSAAVQPRDWSQDPNYRKAQTNMVSAMSKRRNILINAKSAWDTWHKRNPKSQIKTKEQWLSANPRIKDAEPYATQFANATADYEIAEANLARIKANLNRELSDLQKAANDKDFTENYQYTSPTGGQEEFTAGTTFIGDATKNPVTDWASWSTGGTLNLNPWRARVDQGVQPVHKLESVTVTVKTTESFFFGLFESSYEETRTFFRECITYEHFEIEVDFGSVQNYTISRPGWYSATGLFNNRNLSYASDIDFFNPDTGPLFLIPKTIFLGWNPVLKVTLSDALYEKYKKKLESGNGVVFSGVPVGEGMKPKVEDSPFPNAKKLTFGDQNSSESKLQVPVILGYVFTQTNSTSQL